MTGPTEMESAYEQHVTGVPGEAGGGTMTLFEQGGDGLLAQETEGEVEIAIPYDPYSCAWTRLSPQDAEALGRSLVQWATDRSRETSPPPKKALAFDE